MTAEQPKPQQLSSKGKLYALLGGVAVAMAVGAWLTQSSEAADVKKMCVSHVSAVGWGDRAEPVCECTASQTIRLAGWKHFIPVVRGFFDKRELEGVYESALRTCMGG